MTGWVIWAIVAVLLAVGEILTTGLFFLGPLALAAAVALLAAALGAGAVLQVVVFIGGSLASLAVLRPIARRHLRVPPQQRTGIAALSGTTATVVERVDGSGGLVRLKGEVWSARSYLEDDVIEPGIRVHVIEIEGATALVQE